MAFMVPSYTNEPFHVGDNMYGERIAIPVDVYGTIERFAEETATTDCETVTGKWWARLSAPGYMDATDYDGPHDTIEQARASISEMFDCDPDTGDDHVMDPDDPDDACMLAMTSDPVGGES